MIRRWLGWLAPVVLAACLGPADALAQPIEIQRGAQAMPRDPNDESSRTAAMPYAVAAFSLIVVMLILCTPTRKS